MQNIIGQELVLNIVGMGSNGEGIGDYHGFKIFIEQAVSGEQVKIQVTEQKKTYGKGIIIDVINSSSSRQQAKCPLYGQCGGCQYMHISYNQQLCFKQQRIIDALHYIGKISKINLKNIFGPGSKIECVPSPQQFNYRNKLQIPVAGTAQNIQIGLYQKRSHNIIAMKSCLLHTTLGNKIFELLQEQIKQINKYGIIPYNEKNHTGSLRHIIIRTTHYTNQALVIFVTKNQNCPSLNEIGKYIRAKIPEVQGIIQNINNQKGNVILGKSFIKLNGRSHLIEEMLGLKFKISAGSFFQVNTLQAENLYNEVLKLGKFDNSHTIVDAYCGIGVLSIFLAKNIGPVNSERNVKTVKRVIGVEIVTGAIQDALYNAEINNIPNIEFHQGACEDIKKITSI